MDYRREIDGLRALAVLPVIMFHAGFETFSGGFVGVDVFFVISGYLITTIILAELEQGKFSIVNFYERRARRILPALFLVMLVCIPFAWFWLLPSDMKDFSQSLVAVSVFASNILFWRESGYFDTAAELKPLLHTWSLAVEEQYYVLFPLFLMLLWRLGKRWILVMMGLVFVGSLAVAQWAAYAKPAAAFYLLPTRGWELLIGAFAAFYLSKANRKEFGKAIGEFGGWLGVVLILCAVFAYSKATPFPGLYALVPTLGTVLVILFATQQTTVGKFVGNKAFVGVGLISYSAYLWHQPLFAFLKYSKFAVNAYFYGVLIGITLVLAMLTWKYVESPFRNRGVVGRVQILKYSSALAIFFIVFGLLGHESNGFENRDHMNLFKDLTYDTSKLGYAQCDNDLSNKEPKLNYCMGSFEAPSALLVGDSHADDKFYGIEKNVRGLDWMLLGNSSCPPLLDVKVKSADGTECTERLSKLFSYIDKTSSIKVVVLSFAHMYPLEKLIAADHIQGKFDPIDQIIVDTLNPKATNIDAFYAGLRRTVYFLTERNIKTIISLDIPELEFFPSDCLKDGVSCTFSKGSVLQRQQLHRVMAHNLSSEFQKVLIFDPLPLFCENNGDTCSILVDGQSLYRDSHHLTHYGSLKYGEAFSIWFSKSLN
jgi:peptidoglycan/LPS O-acetylase OafA/YrhL